MNYRSLIRTLASSALLVWATHQTASAVAILDFVDKIGGHHATGELRLNSLNDGERPLAGSFFDVDGSGPIAPFDLAPFKWRIVVNRAGLTGFEWPADRLFFLNGVGIPDDVPAQVWQVADPGGKLVSPDGGRYSQGIGDWVARTVPGGVGVPDAGATLTLFATSFAGLAMAGRRWRVVTR